MTFPTSGDIEDRWGWLPTPSLLQENKVTLSPAPGKLSCHKELSLAVPGCVLSWNPQLPRRALLGDMAEI